jgi:gluconate 2-dehydrogenase gamma chain
MLLDPSGYQNANPRMEDSRIQSKRVSTRRTFLITAGVAAGVPLPAVGYTFFTAEEVKLMSALCEEILPSDDLPGAKEAGAVNYIDKQLAGSLARFGSTYRLGLAGLRQVNFLELPPGAGTAFLDRAIAGKEPAVPAAFVRMAIDHTMQGVFGDPKHGGNANRVGWKLIGFADGGGHAH